MINWVILRRSISAWVPSRKAVDFPNARKPAFQLTIDFGELGLKRSSAQITALYSKEGTHRQAGHRSGELPVKPDLNFFSESCLVLGRLYRKQ